MKTTRDPRLLNLSLLCLLIAVVCLCNVGCTSVAVRRPPQELWFVPDTGSMRPYCDAGDLCRLIPGHYSDIQRGSRVDRWFACLNGGKGGWCSHVAIRHESLGWKTQGANNLTEDPGWMDAADFGGFWDVKERMNQSLSATQHAGQRI